MGIHWLILVTLVIAVVQSFIYQRFGLRSVHYERYFSRHAAFEGETVEMVEVIANRKPLPLPWLRLESSIDAKLRFQQQFNFDVSQGQMFQNHKSVFSLMPYTQVTRRHQIACTKRGCFRLNSAAITCGDIAGIGVNSANMQLSAELLVYPKPFPIDQLRLPSHSWQGDISVKRWIVEDPFMTIGVREYQNGDPLHRVHWKATAKTGVLQVHKKDYTSDHRLHIYLNVEDSELMWDRVTDTERIELGISYAAAIAQYAVEQGIEVAFGYNGGTVDQPKEWIRTPCSGGMNHLTYLYETMAKLLIARSLAFDAFLEQAANEGLRNADLLIITAFVSDNLLVQIDRLKALGNAVEIVRIPEAGEAPAFESAGQGGLTHEAFA